MDLKVDDAQLLKIVSAFVFEQLPKEQRDTLIRSAIENVFTSSQYGGRSHLQTMFAESVREVAKKQITDLLSDPDSELSLMLHDGLNDAIERIRQNPTKLVEFFVRSIEDGLGRAVGR